MKYIPIFVVVGCLAGVCWLTIQKPETPDFEVEWVDDVLQRWLDGQMRGQTGHWAWAESIEPTTFYAITHWEVVYSLSDFQRVVRIHSSNAAGVPIVTLWRVTFVDGQIVSTEPATPGT